MTAQVSKDAAVITANGHTIASTSPALYLMPEEIKVDEKFNIRSRYDEKEIDELAQSIQAIGLLTPLTVEETSPGVFELRSGFRRKRALAKAKYTKPVPVIVRAYKSRLDALVDNTAENVRENVRSFDQAKRFALFEAEGMKGPEQAKRTGYNKSHVNNHIRAYKQLEPSILAAWCDGLPAGEGKPAIELPMSLVFSLAGEKHEDQLVRFAAWCAENVPGAPPVPAQTPGTEGSEGEGEGTGQQAAAAVPRKSKEIKAKFDELKERLSDAKEEDNQEKVAELSMYFAALKWCLGQRKTL